MFELLSGYLFEQGKLKIPAVGFFELKFGGAEADISSETISAPAATVAFTDVKSDAGAVADNNDLHLWLAAKKNITIDKAETILNDFGDDIARRLSKGEQVNWPQLGVLTKIDEQIEFVALETNLSPLSHVKAKKIIRENVNHASLVGDKESSTEEMREHFELNKEQRKKSPFLWILLLIAMVALVWFLSQNGCNTTATGNQQQLNSTTSTETYKIQ